VNTTSAWAATAFGEPAGVTPAIPRAASSAAGLASYAATAMPALARLVTMGRPMVPSPMNPTRLPMSASSVQNAPS
jgi:hypothetical protein